MTTGRGRGFASMDPEKRRALAQRGGKRAHELGLAHTFTSAEASAAGKKGGLVTGAQRTAAKALLTNPPKPPEAE